MNISELNKKYSFPEGSIERVYDSIIINDNEVSFDDISNLLVPNLRIRTIFIIGELIKNKEVRMIIKLYSPFTGLLVAEYDNIEDIPDIFIDEVMHQSWEVNERSFEIAYIKNEKKDI